jgi:hypothetical protein
MLGFDFGLGISSRMEESDVFRYASTPLLRLHALLYLEHFV